MLRKLLGIGAQCLGAVRSFYEIQKMESYVQALTVELMDAQWDGEIHIIV